MQNLASLMQPVLAEKISQYIVYCIKVTTIKIPAVWEGSNETNTQ